MTREEIEGNGREARRATAIVKFKAFRECLCAHAEVSAVKDVDTARYLESIMIGEVRLNGISLCLIKPEVRSSSRKSRRIEQPVPWTSPHSTLLRILRIGICLWACGAVGSALSWHGRGRRFEPVQVH